MREKFVNIRLKPESIEKVQVINSILSEYQVDGYDLSVRQLYYQLVARGYTENTQKSYKRICD